MVTGHFYSVFCQHYSVKSFLEDDHNNLSSMGLKKSQHGTAVASTVDADESFVKATRRS